MSIKIRCPHCRKFVTTPDSWHDIREYADTGNIIQTLVERVIAQPVHRHYHTPMPVMRATALVLPLVFFAPSLTLYWNFDPLLVGGFVSTVAASLFVWSSSQIEITEDEDKRDDLEQDPQPAAPQPVIEVSKPGPNSLSIKVAHEPPSNTNPIRQRNLGKADIALARLATGPSPIEPVSWSAAKKSGYRFGEKTFYDIQHRWIREGLAYSAESGAVYLKAAGRRVLSQYAQQSVS